MDIKPQNLSSQRASSASQDLAADWQEFTAADGRRYYYNKKTKQSSWDKPLELMTPLERADASTVWKEFTTKEGKKYYYNKDTKQSTWTIPDELKLAREHAEKEASRGTQSLATLTPSTLDQLSASVSSSNDVSSPVVVTPVILVADVVAGSSSGCAARGSKRKRGACKNLNLEKALEKNGGDPLPISFEQRSNQRKAMTKIRTRPMCDAREVDLSVFGPEVIDPFRAMGWDTFLHLDNSICDHYVKEFYSLYTFDKKAMRVGFAINGKYITLSIADFGAYLGLPASGIDIFCNGKSFINLPQAINRQEMKNLLCKNPNAVGNQMLGKDLKPPHDLRYKIIDWNIYNREGNHNEVSASSAGLLYCLEKRMQVNLALFIAQRMDGTLTNSHRGLPYNMLLNSIFNQFSLPSKPTRKSKHKPLGKETMSRMGKQIPQERGKRPRTEPSKKIEEEDDLFDQIDNFVDKDESGGGLGDNLNMASGSGSQPHDDFYDRNLNDKVNYLYREVKEVKKELGGLMQEIIDFIKSMQEIIDFIKCKETNPQE